MRYWLCVLGGFVVATASLVGAAWGLYHVVRTGTCASGGPYVSARPCPPGTGGQIMAIVGGSFGVFLGAGLYAARGGHRRRGRVGFGTMLWTLGFCMLAGAALLAQFGPAHTGSSGAGAKLAAIIIGAIFIPMGLAPFLYALFSGGDDDSVTGSDMPPTIVPQAFAVTPPVSPRPTTPVTVSWGPTPFGAPPPAGSDDNLDRLEKLAKLHEEGALTDAEFAAAKAKLLSRS